jgi:ribonuclease D
VTGPAPDDVVPEDITPHDNAVEGDAVEDGTIPDSTGHDDAGETPGRPVVDLLEPREGLPPVIETEAELAAAVARLAAGTGPLAVDAERASGYRYGQRAYLVQLRRAGAGTVLIDPIACPDLSGLDEAMDGVQAVLHAASQDLPCLAEIGYRPRELFDTELAGRLLGYPRVALGTMLEEVLGFRLAKEHSAADWSVRPLPAEMLKYAALDVEVLTELRDALAGQLAEQGKTDWARQEFAAVADAPPAAPRPDPWRRTSGIHRVRTRRALGVVRELWQARDEIAREADLSPRRVLTDQAIIDAARAEAGKVALTGRPQLDRIGGFHARNARKYTDRWVAAVLRARELTDAELPEVTGGGMVPGPPPAHRWAERDPVAAARLAAAREAVRELAEAHQMPVENLLPPDALRRLAWEPPVPATAGVIGATLTGYGARPWQAELTAAPIAAAFAAALTTGGGPDDGAPDDGAANSRVPNDIVARDTAGNGATGNGSAAQGGAAQGSAAQGSAAQGGTGTGNGSTGHPSTGHGSTGTEKTGSGG